jgi:hypothetical protein
METISYRRGHLQRLWPLLQSAQPDASSWTKTRRGVKYILSRQPVARESNVTKCDSGRRNLRFCGPDFQRNLPWRWTLQRHRRSRWMQWLSGVQQSYIQDSTSRASASQPCSRSAGAGRRFRSRSGGCTTKCHDCMPELWYDDYAFVEKG